MHVQIGDKAPVFTGKNQDGKEVRLSDYAGKKLVLYFYPKDDTPGCTAQACDLRDNYNVLLKQGYEVLGVSGDDEKAHTKFIKKYNLPFPLIADTDKSINELYGVWVEKSMYGRTYMGTARTTFIIDEQGIVKEIISKVETAAHTHQILGDTVAKPNAAKKAPSTKATKKVATKVTKAKTPAKKAAPKTTKATAPKKKAAAAKTTTKAKATKPSAKKTSKKNK